MVDIVAAAIFQESIVPDNSDLAGRAALVEAYGLQAPVREPSCVSRGSIKGQRRFAGKWTIFDKRMAPERTFAGELVFAIRHEPIDLLVLKRLFDVVDAQEVEQLVRHEPTSVTSRRVWFLYEWLTDRRLDFPDVGKVTYADLLDPKRYVTITPEPSSRHKIRNNLPGVPSFCPVIRRTPEIEKLISEQWDERARDLLGRISDGVIARAASFLLLADSQASYQIEGERPPRNRLERWMRAVKQAGKQSLSIDELVRLQHVVVETGRFVTPGLRTEGGFIGSRDSLNAPLPEFVSARHEDVQELLTGIIEAGSRMSRSQLDAVLHAAMIAFGFVFVHPFEDGNGRIHRYLIHHVLAERGFTPPGIVFPVSSVILDRIDDYAEGLRSFTGPLMPYIEWRPTPKQNVEVLNETVDLYQFGDYTDLAVFLYECVAQTIDQVMPKEIEFLARFDEAKRRIQDMIDMPETLLGNLIMFIRQNGGRLPKKRRGREFEAMTDREVADVERIVSEAFVLTEGAKKSDP